MIFPGPEIRIKKRSSNLYREAAVELVRLSKKALEDKGHITVALSGGTTPSGLYHLLADNADSFRDDVPWGDIRFFWGDERNVGPRHPESNYGAAYLSLLSKVPVKGTNVHRIEGESQDPEVAAKKYEEVLRNVFQLKTGETPRFDLVLLGMGADGHTASLFPGTGVIYEKERLAAAVWVEKLNACRITLTPPVLCNAACVIFLVSGEEKADTLREVLLGDYQPEMYPAQLVKPTKGRLLWLVDLAAASRLGQDDLRGIENQES